MLEAAPLGHMLDALPTISRALTKRGFTRDGGVYDAGDQVVHIKSKIVGGLFVWSSQLSRHHGNADATLEAFTEWLWSGNGFSSDRYAKLGLERPQAPSELVQLASAGSGVRCLEAATTHGLETLRSFKEMRSDCTPGAITNPTAAAGLRRRTNSTAAAPSALPAFGAGLRKFAP